MTGTARCTMQGSWRPLISISTSSPVRRSTLSWGRAMEGVGRRVTSKTTGMPLVMPPLTPPERLVLVRICPFSTVKGSFASLPRR